MKVPMNIKQEVIELKKKDGSKLFLLKENGKWCNITEKEYNDTLRS